MNVEELHSYLETIFGPTLPKSMNTEELIQLLRTTTVAQIRKQAEKDQQEKNIRYDYLVSFVLAAREA